MATEKKLVAELERLAGKLSDADYDPIGTVLLVLADALRYADLDEPRLKRMLSEAQAYAEHTHPEHAEHARKSARAGKSADEEGTQTGNYEHHAHPLRLKQPTAREAFDDAVAAVRKSLEHFPQIEADDLVGAHLRSVMLGEGVSSKMVGAYVGPLVAGAVVAAGGAFDWEAWRQALLRRYVRGMGRAYGRSYRPQWDASLVVEDALLSGGVPATTIDRIAKAGNSKRNRERKKI